MIFAFILLLLGLFLIFVEFYLPGAVLGTLGGISILVSIFVFANDVSSPLLIIMYVLVSIALVVLLIRFTLKRMVRSGSSIYSNKDQEGYVASTYDSQAIGKTGVVISVLKPGGHILVDGKRMLAISQSGYIEVGTEVIIMGGDGESLIVKEKK